MEITVYGTYPRTLTTTWCIQYKIYININYTIRNWGETELITFLN